MDLTKILIVDPEPRSLQALSQLLRYSTGDELEVFAEISAEAALELSNVHELALILISTHASKHRPFSGLEIAERLRSVSSPNRGTPIIFVTGQKRAKEVIFEGYEHAAVDVLIRPLEPRIVASKIRVFVDLWQSRQTVKMRLVEVRRLAEATEKVNHLKSRFLANISHEIRTPLSAILGHAELLQTHAPSKEEQREYLASILQNGAMLADIINNVLDLSKIEAGLLRIERHAFLLDELLDDMQSSFGREAEQKCVPFNIHRHLLPISITSDKARLRQILCNIVGNALKFTGQGNVDLTTKLEDGLLHFIVSDTGCGLSEGDGEALFLPFTQADLSTTRRYGGTGLGLTIARHLAVALGGDVNLVSTQLGRGTTFSVTVDPGLVAEVGNTRSTELTAIKPIIANTPAGPGEVRLDDVNVLMVEDSKHIRSFVRRVLELSGARVDDAEGGEQALAKARSAEATYDIILMDIQMPGMDGHEATRRLRENGYTMPIIAFTAHALQEERDGCLRSGFDAHLTKPIERQKLIATLASLLRRKQDFLELCDCGTPHALVHADHLADRSSPC